MTDMQDTARVGWCYMCIWQLGRGRYECVQIQTKSGSETTDRTAGSISAFCYLTPSSYGSSRIFLGRQQAHHSTYYPKYTLHRLH
jgi:hypothetical protein